MTLLDTFHAKGNTSQSVFQQRNEAEFWVRARRNHKLAVWTCDMTDEDSQNYLRLLLDADFARVETRAVEGFLMLKIRNDLMGFGIFLSPEQLCEVRNRFEQEAWREIAQEGRL